RKAGNRLRLAQRPLLPLQAGDAARRLDPQQLDRDLAIQLRIVRRVDLAHAAPTDQPEADVAPDGGAAREGGEPRILARRTLGALRTGGGPGCRRVCWHRIFPEIPWERRVGGTRAREGGGCPGLRSSADPVRFLSAKPF